MRALNASLKPPIRLSVLVLLFLCSVLSACRGSEPAQSDGRLRVVATTNLVGDAVAIVGGEHISVASLMGPGIDPHLYKASEGDVSRMTQADAIFYGGLHLEGKMVEVFEQMESRGRKTVAVTDGIDRSLLIESQTFGGNYDPHVWFDVALWSHAVLHIGESLAELDPDNASAYRANAADYVERLDSLHVWVTETIAQIPEPVRVLVTSHDAFGYFGRAYDIEVLGLQGISTVSEAGTADVQQLAETVARRRVPALFVESSVSPRGIEAVQAAVRSRGFDVRIGGSLYSDALGDADTAEGTYIGMVRFNVATIASALTPPTDA
jgi:manganese/zinc/iron transport system substrate-binding protein